MPTLKELEEKLAKSMEYEKSLREKITMQKAAEDFEEKIKTSYGAIEEALTAVIKEKGIPVAILDGKFIQLKVSEIGNLNISLVNQVKANNGNGNGNGKAKTSTNGNGNGNGNGHNDKYEYFLKDGSGPFEGIQKAMDALGIDKAKRPQHTRWHRLNKEIQGKIERREKATVEAPVLEKDAVGVN